MHGIAGRRVKQCPDCLKGGFGPKRFSEFNRNARRHDGRAAFCRDHENARKRVRYERNGSDWKERLSRRISGETGVAVDDVLKVVTAIKQFRSPEPEQRRFTEALRRWVR
jgi:hypothetical protein